MLYANSKDPGQQVHLHNLFKTLYIYAIKVSSGFVARNKGPNRTGQISRDFRGEFGDSFLANFFLFLHKTYSFEVSC